MAATSIINVDVRDEAFKKFSALFDEYNSKLKAMPAGWQKVDAVLKSNEKTLAKLAAIVKGTADQIKNAEGSQKKLTIAAQGSIRAFTVLGKQTKQIAKDILSATGSLLKWAGLSGIATGLLGAGGLFGLSRLAESAGQMQITARGAGVTPGQLKAAQINYGQLLGGEGGVTQLLNKLTQMVRNETMRAPLAALGITNFEELKKKSTVDLLEEILPKIRDIMRQPGGLPRLEAMGIGQMIDPNTLVALGTYTDKELDNLKRKTSLDEKTLSIGDNTLGQWANLNRTLGTSAQTIENTFLNALVKLTPSIEKLSSSFSQAIKSLMESSTIKNLLADFAEALNRFSKYITTPQFKEDLENFFDSIVKIGKATVRLAELLEKLLPAETPKADVSKFAPTFKEATGGVVELKRPPVKDVLGLGRMSSNVTVTVIPTPGADHTVIANAAAH